MSRNIPAKLKRKVLVEAGHRCAIPTCHQKEVQIHHIIPWADCQEHKYENLIALCANCHTRADKNELDRISLRTYKDNLRHSNFLIPDITEELTKVSLLRDNGTFLKFEGFFIGECSDNLRWNYTIYKTTDNVKTCDYVIYIDRTNTKIHLGDTEMYEVIQFDSLYSIRTDISKIINDDNCEIKILEFLGIEDSEYLE